MCLRISVNFLVQRLAALLLTVTLAGCDAGLSGRYEEVDGWGCLEFRRDQVYITLAVVGTTIAADYHIDGDKVIIHGPGGAHVYTIGVDGAMTGDMGLRFVKQR